VYDAKEKLVNENLISKVLNAAGFFAKLVDEDPEREAYLFSKSAQAGVVAGYASAYFRGKGLRKGSKGSAWRCTCHSIVEGRCEPCKEGFGKCYEKKVKRGYWPNDHTGK